eukprot:2882153-Alexandrium_andersonii.AAC.1
MGLCFWVRGAPRCPVAAAVGVGAAVLRSGSEWTPAIHHAAAASAAARVERRVEGQALRPAFVGRQDVAVALAGGLGSSQGRRVAVRA